MKREEERGGARRRAAAFCFGWLAQGREARGEGVFKVSTQGSKIHLD